MQKYFKQIKSIPHFYIIRKTESRLFSYYLKDAPAPLLDIGCGDGSFAKTLKLGLTVGIDIDESAIRLNKDCRSFIANAANIPFDDCSFNTVYSNCAVEHMNQIEQVLSEVHRVLNDSGQFVFTVPSDKFLTMVLTDPVLLKTGLADDSEIIKYNKYHNHVNIYDKYTWEQLLVTAGYKVVSIGNYLPEPFGSFVMRMDMLYTLRREDSARTIANLERRLRSPIGIWFWAKFILYLNNINANNNGTHLIIRAVKQ